MDLEDYHRRLQDLKECVEEAAKAGGRGGTEAAPGGLSLIAKANWPRSQALIIADVPSQACV